MSTHSFSPSVSVGAWFFAVLVVVLLAASPTPMTTASEGAATVEPVGATVAPPSRAEVTSRNPSVPAASSVEFPVSEGSERVIASF